MAPVTVTFASWNIQQLSLNKVKRPYFLRVFNYVASIADIILVMEVSTTKDGGTAIATMLNYLNANSTRPNQWRALRSPKDAKSSSKLGDSYAAFYVSGKASLEIHDFPPECDAGNDFANSVFGTGRNPYNYYFELSNQKPLDTFIYHAPNPSDQSNVVTYVRVLGRLNDVKNPDSRFVAVAGDYNTDQSNVTKAFSDLVKAGYTARIAANTTTPACLPTFGALQYANPYDNILTNKAITTSGVINLIQDIANNVSNLRTSFTDGVIQNFPDTLWVYRKYISDHIPVMCTFTIA